MHNGDYGVQVIPEILLEWPAAQGFINPKGKFTSKSKRKLYVYGNEGFYPHCHYIDKDSNREICVRLDKPEYFCHGGKQQTFTSKEKEMFIQFMKYIPKDQKETTWEWCKRTWNGFVEDSDDNMDIITLKNAPDYTKLPTE